MRRRILTGAAAFLAVLLLGSAPALAQSFVGPASGGGWSGTLTSGVLTYNGGTYAVVNAVVTFPDCSTYFVSPNGYLFRGAPAAVNCTPSSGGGSTPSSFVGPSTGGGWTGTISGSNFIYNAQSYPIVNGRVNFPDCTTYIVAPNGALFAGSTTPNCTPSGTLTTPTITWPTPAAAPQGTALSGAQLNATSGGVAGTFVYTPPAGTVMNAAGNQTLSVTFTPTDTATYASAAKTVTLVVTAAGGGGFVGPAAGGGWTGTISGSNFIYNGQSYPIVNARVTFPDCTSYIVAPNGALFGGTTIPNCTPAGTLLTPAITWPTPAAITWGTVLSATQLNATTPVAGTFVYVPAAGAVPEPGNQTLSVTFTPTDTATYAAATKSVTLIVNKITPIITWANPADVLTGTALSATQLGATTTVAGTFVYTPSSGTVMNAVGNQALSTTFTPTDAAHYSQTTASVTLRVVFANPSNGGPLAGTLNGTVLTYNGAQYNVQADGKVYFPDCTNFIVAPNGALLTPGATTANCTPGAGSTPAPNPLASSTNGQVATTKLALASGGAAIWSFDAAYDAGSGRYLVVGYYGSAVRGQYLGRDATPIGSTFNIASVGAFNPRVASNGAGLFLVTYAYVANNAYTLEARVISVATGVVSNAFTIQAGGDFALTYRPGIAWHPLLQQFMVAWGKLSGGGVGQVSTYLTGVTPSATAGLVTVLAAEATLCGASAEYMKHAIPEITILADGTGMLAGYRDSTSPACSPFGGLWYRPLAASGAPTGTVGIVHGTPNALLHREHRLAYSPTLNRYVVAWTRSGDSFYNVLAQKIAPDGTRDGDAYIVRAPILNNADVTDNGFGQVGMAYDPAADQFEMALRGNDPGNGLAPLWRMRLTSTALPAAMGISRVESGSVDPWPVVVSDNTGNFLVVYRLDYPRIAATLITPDGTIPAATPGTVTPPAGPPPGGTTGGGGTPNPNAPNTLGQVVGTTLALASGGAAIWSFDAAYDAGSGRYLVVGYYGDAVRGQYLGRDAVAIGSSFNIASVGAFNPRVASNGAGLFLVTYAYVVNNAYTLEARVISVATGVISNAFTIRAGGDFALTYRPGIAWHPLLQQFIVAWAKVSGGGVGQVSTYLTGVTPSATAGLATVLAAEATLCGASAEYMKHAIPEITILADGTGMLAGYRDSTSPACSSFGGLWYRPLAASGAPTGTVGIVHGTPNALLHREQRLAYSPTLNRYVVAWTRSGDGFYNVLAQKIAPDGTRDGDAYIVRAPILGNADVTDNGFGQVGMAYDPAADQFEMALRGTDPGNGLAPVWRMRLTSTALPAAMTPGRVESGSVDPWPVVVSDNTGNFLIVYRLDYQRIAATLITP